MEPSLAVHSELGKLITENKPNLELKNYMFFFLNILIFILGKIVITNCKSNIRIQCSILGSGSTQGQTGSKKSKKKGRLCQF